MKNMALFRLTQKQVIDLVTYGRVMEHNPDRRPCMLEIYKALGTDRVIIGAGYIDNETRNDIVYKVLPILDSEPLFYVKAEITDSTKYVISDPRILKKDFMERCNILPGATFYREKRGENGGEATLERVFTDAPDNIIAISSLDPKFITCIKSRNATSIRNLLVTPRRTLREKLIMCTEILVH